MPPSVTLTYSTHIISSPAPPTHHVVTPGLVDGPSWSDGTAVRWTEKLAGGLERKDRTPPTSKGQGSRKTDL